MKKVYKLVMLAGLCGMFAGGSRVSSEEVGVESGQQVGVTGVDNQLDAGLVSKDSKLGAKAIIGEIQYQDDAKVKVETVNVEGIFGYKHMLLPIGNTKYGVLLELYYEGKDKFDIRYPRIVIKGESEDLWMDPADDTGLSLNGYSGKLNVKPNANFDGDLWELAGKHGTTAQKSFFVYDDSFKVVKKVNVNYNLTAYTKGADLNLKFNKDSGFLRKQKVNTPAGQFFGYYNDGLMDSYAIQAGEDYYHVGRTGKDSGYNQVSTKDWTWGYGYPEDSTIIEDFANYHFSRNDKTQRVVKHKLNFILEKNAVDKSKFPLQAYSYTHSQLVTGSNNGRGIKVKDIHTGKNLYDVWVNYNTQAKTYNILTGSQVYDGGSMTSYKLNRVGSSNVYENTDSGYKFRLTIKTPVTKVTVSPTSKTINVGSKTTLKATVAPSNATNKAVTWKSSNTSIATVDSKGVVTGRKAGKVTITTTTKDGNKVAKATITVKNVPVKSVKVAATKKTMIAGDKYTMKATISPSNAFNKKVTWKSSNTKVATVNAKGQIIAKKAGSAKITVTTAEGRKTSVTTITVKKKVAVKSVRLNVKKKDINVNSSYTLKATINPSNATNKKVTWKSSNTKIATVNSKGQVTGKKAGKATITVTTNDGKKKASCQVTIKHVKLKKVSVSTSKKTVKVNKTISLKATISPSNASNKKVTWKSANTKLATVNSKGQVTGKKAGKVKLTATTAEGRKTASVTITVTK